MKQVAIITGGGQGIGAATSLLATHRGYAVCVNYLQNHTAANAILWLLSEEASYTTGGFIDVAGGR